MIDAKVQKFLETVSRFDDAPGDTPARRSINQAARDGAARIIEAATHGLITCLQGRDAAFPIEVAAPAAPEPDPASDGAAERDDG